MTKKKRKKSEKVQSNICITGEEASKVIELIKEKYSDVNFCLYDAINETEDKNKIFSFFDAVFYYGKFSESEFINYFTGHNHFRMINSSYGTNELFLEIDSFMGGDTHYEIEKKFIIEYPDIDVLNCLKNAQKVYISQSYINDNGVRKRIRKRGIDGVYSYYLTMKKTISGFKKEEVEYKITREEYETLKNNNKDNLTIEKTRYCLSENFTYYEIDVYPFWKDKAVMEIELKDENEKYILPKNIKIIKDVSTDKNYSNYNLALLNKNKSE